MKKNQTLKSLAASSLAAALIVTAPGLPAYQAFAGEFAIKTVHATATPGVRVNLPNVELGGLNVGSIKSPAIPTVTPVAGIDGVRAVVTAMTAQPGALQMTAAHAVAPSAAAIINKDAQQPAAMTAVTALAPAQTGMTPEATQQAAANSGALVFDGVKTHKGLETAPAITASGVGVSERRVLSRRSGGRLVAKIAAAAAVFAPSMAFAADNASSSGSEGVSGWLIAGGAAVAGGVVAATVSLVRRVARTLDARPTTEEVDAYVKASKVLEFDRYKETSFNGDRLPGPGVREAFDAEIVKITGKSAKDSVAEALTIRGEFHAKYAAYRHPVIAAVVRSFRKPGDGPDSGVPSDVKARHKEMTARRNQLLRLQAMAGSIGREAPMPTEDMLRIFGELNTLHAQIKAVEAAHPILAKSSPGMKAVGALSAVGLGATTLYVLSLVSPEASVLLTMLSAAAGFLGLNIWAYSRMSPEQQKQMGEMARNMSLYK